MIDTEKSMLMSPGDTHTYFSTLVRARGCQFVDSGGSDQPSEPSPLIRAVFIPGLGVWPGTTRPRRRVPDPDCLASICGARSLPPPGGRSPPYPGTTPGAANCWGCVGQDPPQPPPVRSSIEQVLLGASR